MSVMGEFLIKCFWLVVMRNSMVKFSGDMLRHGYTWMNGNLLKIQAVFTLRRRKAVFSCHASIRACVRGLVHQEQIGGVQSTKTYKRWGSPGR